MKWALLALGLLSASYLAYRAWPRARPSAEAGLGAAAPSASLFSPAQLENIRQLATSGQAGPRWAALRLLLELKDPGALERVEQAALRDPDQAVRLAALEALAQTGEVSVAPTLAKAAADPEPEVRLQALRGLESLQRGKGLDFSSLSASERADYERAVEQARRRREGDSQ
ncbi:MAG: HEAT repeat domain-containing protein [Elusimicrobia bacterium]|nr:HEAT repeat domain-containing protein [Elusimicrobiota bacterium]MDE2237635.1 HEAT repeat domain-containing protein [Elusimicrobiota bacterium]MDE2425868.1 HEAT repeat domain-containing protein [Elusimicrobiota bacterium]